MLSLVTLVMLSVNLAAAKKDAEDLRKQAMALELENSRLEEYIQELGTMDAIIRIAQEKLGLVDPDSIVIQPE